jgi:hypothetical protein
MPVLRPAGFEVTSRRGSLACGGTPVTANEFRALALSLPEAVEAAHMGHPDFRVRGKIFATLGHPDEARGMVKLTPAQQAEFTAADREVFQPVPGGWGHQGATYVVLAAASEDVVRRALTSAWRNVAPKRLAARLEEE